MDRSWERAVSRASERDRLWEAVALTHGALKLRLAGDLEVAVRVILEHLGARGECDQRTGDPEACAAILTVWELVAAGEWSAAEAFFDEIADDVLLS